MKKLLLTMALCAITAVMQAVPARRNVHTVAQSDGSTLKIRLRGDESFHYLETADGHPIVNTSNGYMYGKVENGRLMSSGIPRDAGVGIGEVTCGRHLHHNQERTGDLGEFRQQDNEVIDCEC